MSRFCVKLAPFMMKMTENDMSDNLLGSIEEDMKSNSNLDLVYEPSVASLLSIE